MRRARWFLASALALCAAARAQAPLPAPQSGDSEDSDLQHTFAVPETRLANARVKNAQEHIAASRWSEAIEELQKLIEEHRGEMLSGERVLSSRGRPSDEPVYAGAAQHAREILLALPEAGRVLYRARFSGPAKAALEHARVRRDRRELAEVGRRWPLTPEAQSAWWSLGDLEFEEGRAREAHLAWNRALALRFLRPELELESPDDWNTAAEALDTGDPDSKAAAARARAVAAAISAAGVSGRALEEEEEQAALHTSFVGRTSGLPPGRGASAWASPWSLRDPVPAPTNLTRFDAFFLARTGDLLFVNPPLHVLALNAFTGQTVWDSGEPEGWDQLTSSRRSDLFTGVDFGGAMYSAAANARVVVGVLQLPFSLTVTQYFSNLPITKPIPQKRLFAFDARTGKPLWNHRPPPDWEGGPAPFEQRMIVAGPPVISGDRVLAPMYLAEGRIDYHVGCFDVDTGELLWARAVISGQRELNMFGRPPHEFSSPPLVVEGSRVFALTQLGTVACLDLFSGDVLWQTRYEQIVIPRNTGMEAPQFRNVWRPAAPVVAGHVLVATPFDSRDMIGIDVRTGAQIWSLPSSFFVTQGATRYAGQDLLFVGAGPSSVYVQGQAILGLAARGGLDREAPRAPEFLSTNPELARNLNALGRPVIAGRRLVVPLPDSRLEIELPSGHELPTVPWAPGQSGGNLLVGNGELFTISKYSVEGYFEWRQMVARAREEHLRAPADARATELLCQLLGTAAENSLAEGKSEAARAAIEEARTTLEEFSRSAQTLPAALAARMHRTLRLEARVRVALADGERARAALRLARENAPTLEDLRDTLLEEFALCAGRPDAREEVLRTLEERVPGLTLVCVQPAATDGRVPGPLDWSPAGLASPTRDAEAQHLELQLGLWVLLERAASARRQRAATAELASLETLLGDYADVPLPAGSSGVLARARVAEIYAASARDALEPYEAHAAGALARARTRADRDQLARIPELYPCTRAASEANDARVELALQAGVPSELLAILAGEIHGDWRLAGASARELELLARAALGFERAGNTELSSELLRTLAAARPDFKPADPAALGRDLAALGGAKVRWTPPESAAPIGSFRPDALRLWALDGRYQLLGRTLGDDPAAERLQLVAGGESSRGGCELSAWSGANLEHPLWSADVGFMNETGRLDAGNWRARSGLARARVLVAGRDFVRAFDERSGTLAWEWHSAAPLGECTALTVAAGIALVALHPIEDEDGAGDWLQALDARSGAPLWRMRSPGAGVRALPMCGSNAMVFLPPTGNSEIAVHDLFTGARMGSLTLETPVPTKLEEDAWIEGDRLLLPWIDSRRAQIEGWDLALRKRLWHLDLNAGASDPRMLGGILQSGTRTWLFLRPAISSSPDANPTLAELSTGIGALSPLSNVRLSSGDRLLGPLTQKRRRLPSSELFVLSERPQAREETRVRCIDLSAGERWSTTLRTPFQEISGSLTPAPALSSDGLALAYTPFADSKRASSVGSNVVFLDRANGLVRADKRSLAQELFGSSDSLEFVPLGDGLLVRGMHRLEVWR
ncbi:MAG: PQQ-binding-like beta-propeller repeat protein [Planctomycetes bacterium]|nr:PQQ-binding-like beta-propeller repeat protein [Planctomycetota bacterium]